MKIRMVFLILFLVGFAALLPGQKLNDSAASLDEKGVGTSRRAGGSQREETRNILNALQVLDGINEAQTLGIITLAPQVQTPPQAQPSRSPENKYLGRLSENRYNPDSVSNPYGSYGSPYSPNSINNANGIYGSRFSPQSVKNPYATSTPKLYDSEGNYHGKLSSNRYDPESTSNPYGIYGSPYSPLSINNPLGAGNKYRDESPRNPYGKGLLILAPND
ncbi:MAG: hypothetical protein U0V70_02795 [Terriglobia bacterium]